MITKEISNTYILSGSPNILAIEITCRLWVFTWTITRATKIDCHSITNEQIKEESTKLLLQ